MKRNALVLLAIAMVVPMIGCQSATDATVAESSADSQQLTSSDYNLVTLKVPNMT